MVSIPILNEQHWHQLRSENVGASEVAALFDLHPQITKFELWHEKKGNIPRADLSDNERIFWGTMIEPAIANGVAKLKSWRVQKVRRYITHPTVKGMAASLDYEIMGHEKGPGVLEIKTVDWLIFKGWENGTPPLNYELQLQDQMACTDRKWGCLAVLIGGNNLRMFEYDARPATAAKLCAAVTSFWGSIIANEPPKPDYSRDGDALSAIYAATSLNGVIDLSEDNRFPTLCADYKMARKVAGEADKLGDSIKAEMLEKIITAAVAREIVEGDIDRVVCGNFTLAAGIVKGSHIEYDRKPYRLFKLSERKEKEHKNAE